MVMVNSWFCSTHTHTLINKSAVFSRTRCAKTVHNDRLQHNSVGLHLHHRFSVCGVHTLFLNSFFVSPLLFLELYLLCYYYYYECCCCCFFIFHYIQLSLCFNSTYFVFSLHHLFFFLFFFNFVVSHVGFQCLIRACVPFIHYEMCRI